MPESSINSYKQPLTPAVFHILLALADGEKHGYAIMKDVEAQTSGQVKMGPGTLYGSIKRMLAASLIEEKGLGDVPTPLMDANRDGRGFGHGKGYQYPHDFPGHFVPQQYLPVDLKDVRFYNPGEEGYEKQIFERLKAWREINDKALAERQKKSK